MRPQIVLFGDENTQNSFTIGGNGGWGAALARIYSRKADVVVRGYNEYNTNLAMFMLDDIFPTESLTPPIATTVFFGGNDAAISGSSCTHQHVPSSVYKENLGNIVHHLQECSPHMLVVLITPLPVNDSARKIFAGDGGGPDRTNIITGIYAQQCATLAEEMHLPCVDLWTSMQAIDNWRQELLQEDGLHLTNGGHIFVRKAVARVLKQEDQLNPENMVIDFPYAYDIDFKNPEPSFLHIPEA